MVDYFSTTVLSDILTNLEDSPTSIDLLRLRAPSVGASPIIEVDRTFQDDVLDQLGPPIPDLLNEMGNSSATQQQPLIQIL